MKLCETKDVLLISGSTTTEAGIQVSHYPSHTDAEDDRASG